jgi:hypothetical protein
MLDRPYQSTKAAIAAAANFSRPLDLPASSSIRVDSAPDGDGLDRPIAVRAALVSAGIELDSEDAELLFGWARTSDEQAARDEDDVLAETATTEREARDALARGAARRTRVLALLEAVEPALVESGVVLRPPRLAMLKVGWRVVENGKGHRQVVTVVDPSPRDPGVYTGPEGELRAHRVARREVEGEVSHEMRLSVPRRKYPEIAADMLLRWEAGEFSALTELDEEIAERVGCGIRWASRVRESWGIQGSRGAVPTRPPSGVETGTQP